MDKIVKYQLAIKTFYLIKNYAEHGEDYSLLQRTYNEMIEESELDLPKIKWIDNTAFDLY